MATSLPPFFGVGSIACYSGLDQVGEGTYGYVYKAKDKRNGETVALKRLLFHKENLGFPLNAVRELKFLKCLQHKNIVLLKDVVNSKGCEGIEKEVKTDSNRSDKNGKDGKEDKHGNNSTVLSLCGNLYLVFEFVEHDLGGLLDAKYKFATREVKCIAKQLFEVLEYLSEKKILHRDIKSSNILITNRHQIKLADFGLARSIQSADGRELRLDLTNNVVTMWYKAPELLLGAVRYAHAIDVWSVGCVLAELELGRPLFPGRTDMEQMDLICRTLGTPGEDIWTGVQKMPAYESVLLAMSGYTSTLRSALSGRLSDSIIDLLERILVFDPSRRASPKIILTNKYFLTQPLPPIDPVDLEPLNVSAGVSYHEYRTKQQKRQRENDSREKGADGAIAPEFSSGSEEAGPKSAAPALRPPPPPGAPAPAPAASLPAAASAATAFTAASSGMSAPSNPGGSTVLPGYAVSNPTYSGAVDVNSTAGYGAPILTATAASAMNKFAPAPPVVPAYSAYGAYGGGIAPALPSIPAPAYGPYGALPPAPAGGSGGGGGSGGRFGPAGGKQSIYGPSGASQYGGMQGASFPQQQQQQQRAVHGASSSLAAQYSAGASSVSKYGPGGSNAGQGGHAGAAGGHYQSQQTAGGLPVQGGFGAVNAGYGAAIASTSSYSLSVNVSQVYHNNSRAPPQGPPLAGLAPGPGGPHGYGQGSHMPPQLQQYPQQAQGGPGGGGGRFPPGQGYPPQQQQPQQYGNQNHRR